MDPATAAGASFDPQTPPNSIGTAQRFMDPGNRGGVTVSPQSGAVAGNNTGTGGAAPAQNPAITKLLGGDLGGAVRSFIGQIKAANPNFAVPSDFKTALTGSPTGQTNATLPSNTVMPSARSIPSSGALPPPDIGPTGPPTATGPPVTTTREPAPTEKRLIPGAVVAPGSLSTRSLPPGSATRAGAAPVSRETNAPAAAAARPPSYAEWLRARNQKPSDQNFIRYNNETGRAGLPGTRNQARSPGFGVNHGWDANRWGDYTDTDTAPAAMNVGKHFPGGDWQRFMSNARPSTNVEDARGRLPANAINPSRGPQGPDAQLKPLTQEEIKRFDPNDPMTRLLMGSDRNRMRSDVLRSMTPNEMMRWLGEIRREGVPR